MDINLYTRVIGFVIIVFSGFTSCDNRGNDLTRKLNVLPFDRNEEEHKFFQSILSEDTTSLRTILKKNKNLVFLNDDKFGFTPLIFSVANEFYRSSEILLEFGADPNAQDSEGESVLIYHLGNNKSQSQKLFLTSLLKYGANPNQKERNTTSEGQGYEMLPLFEAVSNNDLESVKVLLRHGANLNASLYSGRMNVVTEAIVFENLNILEFLSRIDTLQTPVYGKYIINEFGERIGVKLKDCIKDIDIQNEPRAQKMKERLLIWADTTSKTR